MKNLSVYAAALAALILFPNLIGAQTLNWDATNADSIEFNNYAAFSPQIVISGDTDGDTAVAVWSQSDGTRSHIYSNYSTDGGTTWNDVQLIDNIGNDAYNPQIAISGNTVVAVWEQWLFGDQNIYFNYSTNGGVDWNSAQLFESGGGNAYNPQVAISGDADGDTIVAVWKQNDRVYSNYATIDGTGALVLNSGSARMICDNHNGSVYTPQITISGNTAVAVWERAGDTPPDIHSTYSTDGGVSWVGAQPIESISENAPQGTQIAISGNTVVAVWQQQNGYYNIYSKYATIDGAGAVTWDSTATTIENSDYYAEYPQVAISGNTVVSVWKQSDGIRNRIYSNYATIDGVGAVTWDSTTVDTVSDDGGDADVPQIAISGDNVVAVWSQGAYIYSNYTTIGLDGTVASWDTTTVDIISNNAGSGFNPQIAISGDNAVAVWYQNDGPFHIYSNYAQVVADSNTNDSGSLPVGPLAAGISAFLVWWKRRKQR